MNILSGNSVVDVLPVLFYLVLNSLCLNFHIYKREVVIDNLCKALSAWHTVSAVDVLAATLSSFLTTILSGTLYYPHLKGKEIKA